MEGPTPSENGPPGARETSIPLGDARLFCRDVGSGRPIIVLHGGPEFDHAYLVPDMDRLAADFRLIYYDQRGRGRSAQNVRPEDVSLASEIEDLDAVRRHFDLDPVALLGHSWGALLALEYALRHPNHVSHLVLMNPAPVSNPDAELVRSARRSTSPGQIAEMKALAATRGYQEGDPEVFGEYLGVHFRFALHRPAEVDKLVARFRAGLTREGILKGRAIEERLANDTQASPDYDLLPKLESLTIPTLVIHGDGDFIPIACSQHIADAIPRARLEVIEDCGHFAYLEAPDDVRARIVNFFGADGG